MSEKPGTTLQRYQRDHSETAFRELVRLHSALVHGSALRLLGGDRAAAEDVTQEVFTLLARKAKGLDEASLPGWLYRQACRRASNHRRAEARRKHRELVSVQAMNSSESSSRERQAIADEIDDALFSLPGKDRDALVLRYFEDRDFRNVGALLGTTEEAARKRVDRALERLIGLLKLRGVNVGSAALGSTMTGFGSAPLPPAVISQISSRAMESIAVGSGSGITSILRPFIGGALLTSLVAAATLVASRSGSSSHDGQAAPRTAGNGSRTDLRRVEDSAPIDLISRIKRIKAGPDHAMTTLRLSALLDSITFDEIPGFIAEANKRLTLAEQNACYLPLLKRWLESDPGAAAAFALKFDSELKPPGFGSTDMVRFLLHSWGNRDLDALARWLGENWEQPTMKNSTFSGDLRTYFAIDISDVLLRDRSAAEAFAYLRTLPDQKTVNACMRAMTGDSVHASAYMNIGPDRLLELYREFSRLPDPVLAGQLKVKLWQTLAQNEPEYVETMLAAMDARERFEATLHRIGKYSKQVSRVQTPGGESMSFETVDNTAQGEADAMTAGLEAGLSRSEILQQIGIAIVMKEEGKTALEWLDLHRGEFDADPILLAKISGMQRDNFPPSFMTPSEGGLLLWATRLQDPELRMKLCRAGFRLMIAGSPGRAGEYLSQPDLPEDLKAEFTRIISSSAP
ncbi:sigma-70 family RNA polymerase sigma factor [Luteolibacter sp. GHJ8]|uniref:Sigma-70 family RNA polymerase sigma factor n=1 Tax=Luteolibacter rhizosphaerae TaxID=2989719 RepID=A0ABT3G337_9BACT|nr:sigma-70 family RNA polymerase sigma factor [Luteolibacter rhizosphaerae]MCW1914072.1 sigma-70 family RNA polymerase sigma factor [Luteolibacter rhizosphaerae]